MTIKKISKETFHYKPKGGNVTEQKHLNMLILKPMETLLQVMNVFLQLLHRKAWCVTIFSSSIYCILITKL